MQRTAIIFLSMTMALLISACSQTHETSSITNNTAQTNNSSPVAEEVPAQTDATGIVAAEESAPTINTNSDPNASVPLNSIETSSKYTTPASYSKYKIDILSNVGFSADDVDMDMDIAFPDIPETMPVYKMVVPEITEDYVRELGLKFGMTGDPDKNGDKFNIIDEETGANLEVYRSTGTVRYLLPGKYLYESNPELPSNEEAMEIVTAFLKEVGLLTENDVASGVSAGGRSGSVTTHLLVSFKHVINITGPGARHGVRIGDKGKIVQVFINPTNPLEMPVYETVTLKPVDQAFEELKDGKKYLVPSEEVKTVKINNIYTAYWLESISKGQEYIVPVYVFEGYCLDSEGNQLSDIYNFEYWVEAVN